jgi:hypothetical protein
MSEPCARAYGVPGAGSPQAQSRPPQLSANVRPTNMNAAQDKVSRAWHMPDPTSLGEIVGEATSSDRRHKVTIIRDKKRYLVYLYEFTDSDVTEGRGTSVGWFRIEGPSLTDSLQSANDIAETHISRLNKRQE